MNPDEMFDSVVEVVLGYPEITKAKMFGSPSLKIGKKVFACLVKGRLVVKLPQQRVEAIVASGDGEHFDPGMGRLMKEWVAIEPDAKVDWLSLVEEARDFVAAGL